MGYLYRAGERDYEVEIGHLGGRRFRVVVDGVSLEVEAEPCGDSLELRSERGNVRVWVSRGGDLRFVSAPGIGEAIVERVARRRRVDDHAGDLSSPMPGKVVKVLVAAGAAVQKGDTLIIVEAMKTELRIMAPRGGVVARVQAREGEMCGAGAPLVELE